MTAQPETVHMGTFGEEIRRERELRQFTLRQVADATKINLRYLQALEGNDFEHLPGGVFNRGFVRAYSEFIGIDPETMVNAYLLEEQAQRTGGKTRDRQMFRRLRADAHGIKQPTQEAVRAGIRPRIVVAWAVLAVLAAVIALLSYRALSGTGPGTGQEASSPSTSRPSPPEETP